MGELPPYREVRMHVTDMKLNNDAMSGKKLAAFIMTYERPETLVDTIQKILSQTLSPDKILVVDNSASDTTRLRIEGLHPRVFYHKMGYNAGPAGAAKAGLNILVKEGYQWVFWGDDDDPPPTPDCFEKLIALGENYQGRCGQVGMVGHRFNKITGLFRRTRNDELFNTEFIHVDSVGGGQCKIVNSQVVLNGVSPDEKIFFGFEELDFDLALKKAGYDTLVHSSLFLGCRERHNRMNFKKQVGSRKKTNAMWRDYYSIRNMLYILAKNRLYLAFLSALCMAFGKSLISYKHGIKYGSQVTRITFRAIKDFAFGRYYKMAD